MIYDNNSPLPFLENGNDDDKEQTMIVLNILLLQLLLLLLLLPRMLYTFEIFPPPHHHLCIFSPDEERTWWWHQQRRRRRWGWWQQRQRVTLNTTHKTTGPFDTISICHDANWFLTPTRMTTAWLARIAARTTTATTIDVMIDSTTVRFLLSDAYLRTYW